MSAGGDRMGVPAGRRRPMQVPLRGCRGARGGSVETSVEGGARRLRDFRRGSGGARRGRFRGPRRDVVAGLVEGSLRLPAGRCQSSPSGSPEYVWGLLRGWWRRLPRGLRGRRKRPCRGWSQGLRGPLGRLVVKGVGVVSRASEEGGGEGCGGGLRGLRVVGWRGRRRVFEAARKRSCGGW